MTMNGMIYCNTVANNHVMPEWVRSERYEFCEDFYEGYTTGKSARFFEKLASILTSLFI